VKKFLFVAVTAAAVVLPLESAFARGGGGGPRGPVGGTRPGAVGGGAGAMGGPARRDQSKSQKELRERSEQEDRDGCLRDAQDDAR
jgi:hypothetical protein